MESNQTNKPAGKGLTSWLSFAMFNCDFDTFPCGILGQVWYLIVSITDLSFLNIQILHNDWSYIEDVHLPFCAHLTFLSFLTGVELTTFFHPKCIGVPTLCNW